MNQLEKDHVVSLWVGHIVSWAPQHDLRTGQYLFNSLPNEVARVVSGTLFDPFHTDMKSGDIWNWIDNHLIFSDDGNQIIAVFNNNQILWQAEDR